MKKTILAILAITSLLLLHAQEKLGVACPYLEFFCHNDPPKNKAIPHESCMRNA